MNKNSTKIALSTFLYNLQQPNKCLSDPASSLVLKELQLNPGLVPNKNAKNILNRLPGTTKKNWKKKRPLRLFGMPATKILKKIQKTKGRARKRGQLSEKEKKDWKKFIHKVPLLMEVFKTS